MLFGWYFDWTFIILIPGVIFAIWAQLRVSSTFSKYSKIPNFRGMTGAEAALAVLHSNGIYDVKIEHIKGNLTDHYSPKEKVIRLSDAVYDSATVAAIGVAAHEAGHAVQYAENYFPMKLRSLVIPATNIGSMLSIPLFIIGLLFANELLMMTGIAFYSVIILFQLLTLPVEFNASGRAMRIISKQGLLYGDEAEGAKKVLGAAALTYVAALLSSVLTLLRLLLLASGRRR